MTRSITFVGLFMFLVHCGVSVGHANVPTFAEDVAPIISQNCVACHQPEGSAPFSLIGYQNTKRRAQQIVEVTEDRFMPPWKPVRGFGPDLKGDRRLSDQQLTLLKQWNKEGAPPGRLESVPEVELTAGGWSLGEPDLILELEEPYVLKADGRDEFRNFVIKIPLESSRWVRAVEFQPEAKLAIHHAIIAMDPTDSTRRQDEADPLPGYESMELGAAVRPFGHLIGWAPGQVPYECHPGTAWQIHPGTDLVVQLHMLPVGRDLEVSPRIGLYFTNEAPTKQSMVMQLRENEIDIPAGENAYEIEETLVLPTDVQVLGLFPHAHYLCRDMQIWAELPDGAKQGLLRISDWDFNWQSDYRYVDPLPLPAGTKLMMRYTYDNSADNIRNPSSPPRRVTSGWGSFEEMGEVAVQVLLDQRDDWSKLQETQTRYDIEKTGQRPTLYFQLAAALRHQGRIEEAETTLRELLSLYPQDLSIRLYLAEHLASQDQRREVVELLAGGLSWHGESSMYREQLAQAYMRVGVGSRAMAHFKEAAVIEERNDPVRAASLWFDVAIIGSSMKNPDATREALAKSMALDPNNGAALLLSAVVELDQQDHASAGARLRSYANLSAENRLPAERVFELLPFPIGLLKLAETYDETGNPELALELIRHVRREAEANGMVGLAESLAKLEASNSAE